jgi:MOSC domain-containing protein YiiM
MRAGTIWQGRLEYIYIAEKASAPMRALPEARLTAGVGIDGDRYATGKGYYSKTPRSDRQVTLIEIETLEALQRDHAIDLGPAETRRNLTTREVPLNHLVGKRFRVGSVLLYGVRLNVPCKYLEQVTGKPVYEPLVHRSGLNCEIVEGGVIRAGDLIVPA